MKKFIVECSTNNAPRFREWINTRGGVALWKSINLSNPGATWLTPACNEDGTPTKQPTWQCANVPTITTDAADVGVVTDVLFKAFPVALRRANLSFKLTDAAQRRVDNALAECKEKHGSAHYKTGVLEIERASIGIYYTDKVVALSEFVS